MHKTKVIRFVDNIGTILAFNQWPNNTHFIQIHASVVMYPRVGGSVSVNVEYPLKNDCPCFLGLTDH